MARYVSLLAPFAPHISEELWHRLGHDESVHRGGWPDWDAELVKEDIVTIVVQVNGKLRGEFRFDRGVSQEAVVEEASRDDKIAGYLDQGELVKTIFVADKLVNFVVK
jgi:leucyl-tRNA synthetase